MLVLSKACPSVVPAPMDWAYSDLGVLRRNRVSSSAADVQQVKFRAFVDSEFYLHPSGGTGVHPNPNPNPYRILLDEVWTDI